MSSGTVAKGIMTLRQNLLTAENDAPRASGVMHLVSVVINNYNYADYLADAIDSALNQTYTPLEVVVVDDGSTDNSATVIWGYGGRITPVIKENGGQGSAINAGVAASKGQIVTLLDADDVLYPDAVARIVEGFEPEVVQVQACLELVTTGFKKIDRYPRHSLTFDDGDVLPLLLRKGRYVTSITSGLSFTRDALDRVLPIPEGDFRISADGYLVSTVPFYGLVASISTPIAARREHGGNAWVATMAQFGPTLRKWIEHEHTKFRYIRRLAQRESHSAAATMEYNDQPVLAMRLASLRWEPQDHPVATDRAVPLAFRGIRALWWYSSGSIGYKIVYTWWFLWVGMLPGRVCRAAVTWRYLPESRSAFVRNSGRLLRRLLGDLPVNMRAASPEKE